MGSSSETLIRICSAGYRDENKSFGLTTLLARHVEFLHGRAMFRLRGKSGLKHALAIDNSRLVRLLHRVQQLPGQLFFEHLDDDNELKPIDLGMVNDSLIAAMGGEFIARDFRTWDATVEGIAVLAELPLPEPPDERTLATLVNEAIGSVAKALRNTPAVCRSSYIHPRVITGWNDGHPHRTISLCAVRFLRKLECAILQFPVSNSSSGCVPSGILRACALANGCQDLWFWIAPPALNLARPTGSEVTHGPLWPHPRWKLPILVPIDTLTAGVEHREWTLSGHSLKPSAKDQRSE